MGKRLAIAASLILSLISICAEAADCSQFIPFGEPALATARPITKLCRTAYLVAHDDQRLAYDWVAWTLTAEHSLGCEARHNQFHVDQDLLANRRASPADYAGTGYDQGHGFPDQDGTWDKRVQFESFAMSNMAPQAPGLNRMGWEQIEAESRAWAVQGFGPLTIYDIPIWSASPKTIGKDGVAVPDAFAKVIYSPVKHQAVAVLMPNAPVGKKDVDMYVVAVADVERQAGVSVPLPDDVDKNHVVIPWRSDLSAFARTKKATCAH